jgi:hypothetical protein
MKEIAHLGHAWRADQLYAFARGPRPIGTSLTRPKDSSCIYIRPGAGRDDGKSVGVVVYPTVVMNMG